MEVEGLAGERPELGHGDALGDDVLEGWGRDDELAPAGAVGELPRAEDAEVREAAPGLPEPPGLPDAEPPPSSGRRRR